MHAPRPCDGICSKYKRGQEECVTLDGVIAERTSIYRKEGTLPRVLPPQLSQTGSQGKGRTYIKNLKVYSEGDLYSQRRYGDFNHLEVLYRHKCAKKRVIVRYMPAVFLSEHLEIGTNLNKDPRSMLMCS